MLQLLEFIRSRSVNNFMDPKTLNARGKSHLRIGWWDIYFSTILNERKQCIIPQQNNRNQNNFYLEMLYALFRKNI